MKKRGVSLLLALCLLLAFTPAEAENRNLYASEDSIACDAIAVIGDTLYLLISPDGITLSLRRWKAGMEEPEVIIDGGLDRWSIVGDEIVVDNLFTDGTRLYGFDLKNCNVTLLVDENGNAGIQKLFQLEIPFQLNIAYVPYGIAFAVFVVGNEIHSLQSIDINELQVKYMRYDLTTGKTLASFEGAKMDCVMDMLAYKDGLLLALCQPKNADWNSPYQLCTFDPETGKFTELGTLPAGDRSLFYHAQTDSIYFMHNEVLNRFLPDGTYEPSIYLPLDFSLWLDSQTFAILPDDTLVIARYANIFLRDADIADPQGNKFIVSSSDDVHYSILLQNPDLPLGLRECLGTPKALISDFTQEVDPVDVYSLRASPTEVQQLADAGYLADLSGIPGVKEFMAQINPNFSEPLTGENGEVYALPVAFEPNILGYSPSALRKLGLPVSKLPKSLEALCTFIATWQEEIDEDFYYVLPFSDYGMRNRLLSMLLESYVAHQLHTEGTVVFDTPLLRKLLAAMEQIDFDAFDPYETFGPYPWPNLPYDYSNKEGLFSDILDMGATSESSSHYQHHTPLAFSLDETTEPVIPVTLQSLVVRANTPSMALAERYVSAYIENLTGETLLLLAPSLDESATVFYRENYFPYLYPTREIEPVTWFDAPIDDTTSPMVPYLQHKTSIDEFLQAMDVYYATEAP